MLLTRETHSPTDKYDQDDVRFFQNYKLSGHYHLDAKNFVHCTFETQFWNFTGIFTGTDNQILVFHNHDSRLLQNWSGVFILVERFTQKHIITAMCIPQTTSALLN